MKNKNKPFIKQGFTLAEVVIAIAIVGIVTALALTTMKPSKKAIKYQYINAYSAVERAYYNGMLKGYDPFSSKKVDGAEPEHTATKDTGALQLCRGLTTFINTKDAERDTDDGFGQAYDYSSSCSDTKLTSELANSFTDEKVQFVASNGMKFYITKQLGGVNEGDVKFYLVFVDINGEKKPNSFEYDYYSNGTVKTEPDIHAFVILQSGHVIPIGAAEYDPVILTARVAYFDENGEVQFTRTSRAYYQAKGEAWGYYSSDKMVPAAEKYNESEWFSMNDYIRNKLSEIAPLSKIVTATPDFTTLKPREALENETNNCVADDLESCYIFLDEYRQQ